MKSHNVELSPAFYSRLSESRCLRGHSDSNHSLMKMTFLLETLPHVTFKKLELGTHLKDIQTFKEGQKLYLSGNVP